MCLGHFTKLPLSYTLAVKKEKGLITLALGFHVFPGYN